MLREGENGMELETQLLKIKGKWSQAEITRGYRRFWFFFVEKPSYRTALTLITWRNDYQIHGEFLEIYREANPLMEDPMEFNAKKVVVCPEDLGYLIKFFEKELTLLQSKGEQQMEDRIQDIKRTLTALEEILYQTDFEKETVLYESL